MCEEIVQILNISNVNTQGIKVLNDATLLDLIVTYPLLYNPRAEAYNDPDYSEWAWKCISDAFNESYKDNCGAPFSAQDLMKRWQTLKLIIRCFSENTDMNSVPQPLRQSIIAISKEFNDECPVTSIKSYDVAQEYLLKQAPKIAELPRQQQLDLESDLLDLFLRFELHVNGSSNSSREERIKIVKDTDAFLKDICFFPTFVMALGDETGLRPVTISEPIVIDSDDDDSSKNDNHDNTNNNNKEDYTSHQLKKNASFILKGFTWKTIYH